MTMSKLLKKPTSVIVLVGVVVFSFIYFGLSTKPSEQRAVEKSRAKNIQATSIQNLVTNAHDLLSKEQISLIGALNDRVTEAQDTFAKKDALVALSKEWYSQGFATISGYYAEEVSKLSEDDTSWSVAGTTYMLGMRSAKSENEKIFARGRAIQALEKAISLAPDDVSNKVNLALLYVEAPDENPMHGILMLRDLNTEYPESVIVLNQLGRLAIQTNQTDKALERLTKAIEIEPDNAKTICLLAVAYGMKGDETLAAQYNDRCNKNN